MRQCFDDVDKALTDKRASVPLVNLESRLEDHFQVVYSATAVAGQGNANGELKQIVEDLLTFSQSLLQEIYTTKSQRETNSKRSKAWISF